MASPGETVESGTRPWADARDEVTAALGVVVDVGLSDADAVRRRAHFGDNRLRVSRPTPWWLLLVRQFRSLVVALLGAAAGVSFLFGETVEAAAIVAVLVINAGLGFVAELRAVRSMEALRRLGAQTTRVRRAGRDEEIPAEALVPGDVVPFESGDKIAADLRLVDGAQVEADEAILTGESLPVAKGAEAVAPTADLHERTSMLFKGTTVNRGAGVGVVVATGMATELGRIAELVDSAEEEVTPLEERLDELGRRLIGATVAIAAAAATVGILVGKPFVLMIQTGIALAIAAIPEGLPIVATIALARGMWRMASRNALINRLASVETLGATTLILTDKTGTLTENRMQVARIVAGNGQDTRVLRIAALCNDASLVDDEAGVGDPLEIALLVAAARAGLRRTELLDDYPEVREEPFDSRTRMMATFHRHDGHVEVAVKGAADALLEHADRVATPDGDMRLDDVERQRWQGIDADLAGQGFRVLGVATKTAASVDEGPYDGLVLVGLVALVDPPRDDATRAIAACRAAGIRVVMVTGDQAATALHVARAVGLVDAEDAVVVTGRELRDSPEPTPEEVRRRLSTAVFARVDPEQKLDLIQLHQRAGEVVAMTGDGVNDAPALKRADIGVAMGRRGTQVAQEAADMVLTDDSLGSIVEAVRQGRVIFGNVRKFVTYLMSCNLSEIFIVAGAVAFDVPLPLLPLQILFLNLVTDVFPALALALGDGDPGLMRQPPRNPDDPILTREHWLRIGALSGVMTVAVLGALALALSVLDFSTPRAVTVSFATLALAQLWHVFNLRGRESALLRNDIVGNRWIWGALALCTLLTVAAVHLPGLSTVLRTTDPGLAGWVVIVGMSLVPLAVGQAWLARPRPG